MVRRIAAVVALLSVAAAWGITAGAQDVPVVGQVRSVDSANPKETLVAFTYSGDPDDVSKLKVSANGKSVDANGLGSMERGRGVVVVVDTSMAMDKANGLTAARDGLLQMVNELENEQVAIVAAGEEPDLISNFSSDPAILSGQIEGITAVQPDETANPNGDAAIWDSVRFAANVMADRPSLQPNIMIITGSADPVGSYTRARGAIANANAAVLAINFQGAGGEPGALVGDFGVQNINAPKPDELTKAIPAANDTIKRNYQFTYDPNVDVGELVDLDLSIGDTDFNAKYVQGTSAEGAQALNPQEAGGSPGIGALQNPLGLLLAVLAVLVACGLGAYALMSLFVPDDSLSNVLEVYSEGFSADDDDDDGSVSLAKSAVIARAVELTEQVADSQGYLARAESALERASLPLRAGEALFFYAVIVIGLTLLALVFTRNLLFGIMIGLFAAVIPVVVVSFLAGRRKRKFLSQLPDTLQLLAGTLRAGYSLMQGVEAVSQEIDGPMGVELRRVVTEARLGRPLEESLEGTADRMNSEDFAWCVMAIKIQREVGGNLAELLLTVADTMTQRERLRRDVKSLTAEGRISALVLGFLPVGLGLAMYVLNPAYIGKLFEDTLGNIMLGVSLVSMGIGFFWMKKIIDIEI